MEKASLRWPSSLVALMQLLQLWDSPASKHYRIPLRGFASHEGRVSATTATLLKHKIRKWVGELSSPFFLNKGVAQRFHELFPTSDLFLLPTARHFVQMDEPEELARLIVTTPIL